MNEISNPSINNNDNNNIDESISSKNTFNKQILLFKEDVLKDIKIIENKLKNKLDNNSIIIENKFNDYNNKLENLSQKIYNLSNLISFDNNIQEKIDSLIKFKNKIKDDYLSQDFKIESNYKELRDSIFAHDKLLSESIIYPGIIGQMCKFKNLHQFIDYSLLNISDFLSYKEKNNIDLKSYKVKLEIMMKNMKIQMENLSKTITDYTKKCIEQSEFKLIEMINSFHDKIEEVKLVNSKYVFDLNEKIEFLNKEIEKTIDDKIKNEIVSYKKNNKISNKNLESYKKDFIEIKSQISNLKINIKEIKSEINSIKSEKKNDLNNNINSNIVLNNKSKEIKESKESKENKEIKESKESKENKEIKESKESKENNNNKNKSNTTNNLNTKKDDLKNRNNNKLVYNSKTNNKKEVVSFNDTSSKYNEENSENKLPNIVFSNNENEFNNNNESNSNIKIISNNNSESNEEELYDFSKINLLKRIKNITNQNKNSLYLTNQNKSFNDKKIKSNDSDSNNNLNNEEETKNIKMITFKIHKSNSAENLTKIDKKNLFPKIFLRNYNDNSIKLVKSYSEEDNNTSINAGTIITPLFKLKKFLKPSLHAEMFKSIDGDKSYFNKHNSKVSYIGTSIQVIHSNKKENKEKEIEKEKDKEKNKEKEKDKESEINEITENFRKKKNFLSSSSRSNDAKEIEKLVNHIKENISIYKFEKKDDEEHLFNKKLFEKNKNLINKSVKAKEIQSNSNDKINNYYNIIKNEDLENKYSKLSVILNNQPKNIPKTNLLLNSTDKLLFKKKEEK